jgi:hypothetical protein
MNSGGIEPSSKIGGVEVGALLRYEGLALLPMNALLADRDLALLIETYRFKTGFRESVHFGDGSCSFCWFLAFIFSDARIA